MTVGAVELHASVTVGGRSCMALVDRWGQGAEEGQLACRERGKRLLG